MSLNKHITNWKHVVFDHCFFISGGSLVSWSIHLQFLFSKSSFKLLIFTYWNNWNQKNPEILYKESPFLHKATGFLQCLQPVTLTQIFPPCAKKYWDMANQLGCFLQKVQVIRLHWNVKLCCLYYFFSKFNLPNWGMRLIYGCGLYTVFYGNVFILLWVMA